MTMLTLSKAEELIQNYSNSMLSTTRTILAKLMVVLSVPSGEFERSQEDELVSMILTLDDHEYNSLICFIARLNTHLIAKKISYDFHNALHSTLSDFLMKRSPSEIASNRTLLALLLSESDEQAELLSADIQLLSPEFLLLLIGFLGTSRHHINAGTKREALISYLSSLDASTQHTLKLLLTQITGYANHRQFTDILIDFYRDQSMGNDPSTLKALLASLLSTYPHPILQDISTQLSSEQQIIFTKLMLTIVSRDVWKGASPQAELTKQILLFEKVSFRATVLLLTRIASYGYNKNDSSLLSYELRENILKSLYRDKKCLDAVFVYDLVSVFSFRDTRDYGLNGLWKAFIGLLEKTKKNFGFNSEFIQNIQTVYDRFPQFFGSENKFNRDLKMRIEDLLTVSNTPAMPLDNQAGKHGHYEDYHKAVGLSDAGWPAQINTEIEQLSPEQQHAWYALWAYAATAKGSSPSATWLKKGQVLLPALADDFSIKAAAWLALILADLPKDDIPFSDRNLLTMKGFIWLCRYGKPALIATGLGDMAQFCYGKLYGIGARSSPLANACLSTLGYLDAQGVMQLSKLRGKVKYDAGLKQIEKALNEAAVRQGISQDDLEELAVPTFDFGMNGKTFTIDTYRIIVKITGSKHVDTVILNNEMKEIKALPATIKKEYATGLKNLKKDTLAITDALVGQVNRLEASFLRARQWRYDDWQTRFVHHPILGWLGQRLIWVFETDGVTQHGLYLNGQLVNALEQPLSVKAENTIIRLWHPILSDVSEVQQWRTLLRKYQIVQPIKQAYREVYILTPAEIQTGDYSNRFAGHILKQFQMAALCKERGWQYRLQGGWDGANEPTRLLEHANIGARLELAYNEGLTAEMGQTGVYTYVQTATVRFFSLDAGQIPLEQVPPLIFSELMRDVDLFVGVCSIGTDPALQALGTTGTLGTYIQSTATADLTANALIRKDVLDNIVSKLAIAPRCQFEGKYLIVRGDIRSYKIHLASGNILMTPNDQYLCIVQDHKKTDAAIDGIYLPFEGDHMLSVILSKALLLANDLKITDPSIVAQIKRP